MSSDAESVATNLPGAPRMSTALGARLAAALAAKGSAYVPRTHHKNGSAPTYTNRLILESSPYLLQHAHNPVNWYPWGDEAFADARALGRPVFLSIGYSTCHWCHVMEGESFEDEEIAAFMNTHFICIKVDREERPDIDAIYMSAVQNLTGSGGWPMSVWLTPDREPFFAGTYFPPRDGARGARHGFLTVLGELARTYAEDPARVKRAAGALVAAVRADMDKQGGGASDAMPDATLIRASVDHFKQVFDARWGGVRRAPKFPSNMPVRLLLRYHRRTGDTESLAMATTTLERMAAGGMYDQIGGGFHRYSTDERWLVPHFEKMLYDNALLALAYTEAFQVTGRADFARVARETLDYVLREMTAPEGAFFSATDADSLDARGAMEEGAFFVWSLDDVKSVLGADADEFIAHYGLTTAGNFEGHNIPFVATPDEGAWARLGPARAKLYQARARRPAPLRDEKILAAWNGLMISAMAVAGRVFAEPRYGAAAERAAAFVLDHMRVGDRLARSWKDGRAQAEGFLDDHACVAAGLLDLFEADAKPRWLREAVSVSLALQNHFADGQHGGWFMTARDAEALLAREKPNYDGAEPSGTSVAILNALRLALHTSDDSWRVIAERALSSFREHLENRTLAMTEALLALDFHSDVPREIVIVGPAGQLVDPADPLVAATRTAFVPNKALVVVSDGEPLTNVSAAAPFASEKRALGGKTTAYVCVQGRCEKPTHDARELVAQLARVTPYPTGR